MGKIDLFFKNFDDLYKSNEGLSYEVEVVMLKNFFSFF